MKIAKSDIMTATEKERPMAQTNDGPSRVSQVREKSDHLNKRLDVLDQSLHTLEERLMAVLRPPAPATGTGEEKAMVAEPLCGLAQDFQSKATHVYQLEAMIENILARLEI
jgi:hypothetical protein